MFLAETIQPQPESTQVVIAIAVLAAFALVVVGRMISGIRRDGVQTRPDLLETTDVLIASVIMILYAMLLANRWTGGEPAAAAEAAKIEPGQLITTMVGLLIFPSAIVLMMIARNLSPVDVFGFGKVGVTRACVLGAGLGLIAVPLTAAVKLLTVALTGSTEGQQQLVQNITRAVGGGAWETFGLIALSVVVIAPLSEEVLFRGYFYPVLGRWFGRIVGAIIAAVFFGALHDTLIDIPGLAVLALCFTIAYERTGSLLVPFVGHACFNGVTLVALWYQAKYGITP